VDPPTLHREEDLADPTTLQLETTTIPRQVEAEVMEITPRRAMMVMVAKSPPVTRSKVQSRRRSAVCSVKAKSTKVASNKESLLLAVTTIILLEILVQETLDMVIIPAPILATVTTQTLVPVTGEIPPVLTLVTETTPTTPITSVFVQVQ